jgi:hypothetical protein
MILIIYVVYLMYVWIFDHYLILLMLMYLYVVMEYLMLIDNLLMDLVKCHHYRVD